MQFRKTIFYKREEANTLPPPTMTSFHYVILLVPLKIRGTNLSLLFEEVLLIALRQRYPLRVGVCFL